TVFEIMTALAMWYYAQERIEYGVFEVGMGGRLDATNVLRPMVSVITSISKDHTKVLGDTIEAIAREKAGIIKHGVPVVSAPQRPEALGVIEETSGEREAPLTLVTRDWHWRLLGSDLDGQRLTVYRRGHEARPEYPELHIPLLGTHQLENACVAVAAVESLREQGVSVTREAVARGLARVLWPGRMELLGRVPLVMVDGAHNPYSMRQLLASARRYLPYRRLHAIFGAGYTHVPDELLAILLPKADCLYVTQAHHPKAAPPAELQAMVSALGSEAHPCAHVGEALSQAMDVAAEDDLILVTGSLFIVAEACSAWAAMEGLPPYPSDPPGVY
ncbi:MAG: bifunctional folylpolyglutamate synthase/dihydrofolate synthase, partial [Chloroflexi bacterium]|nr:bifunctional folylpolyglutamate synthase/dihydrofolate synthase [Chloroflexota bacterium]